MEETNEVALLTYLPRYVKQVADYLHGDTLDHEAYNQLININSTQGDYNTEVLNTLLNGNPEGEYHIKYVDEKFTNLDSTISDISTNVDDILTTIDNIGDALDTINNAFAAIEDGTQVVGHAQVADNLYGLVESGPNKYYGTDANAHAGFFDVPEVIYCQDISSAVNFSGINIVPAPNSVAENMLTTEVQTKLNRQQGVTDYDYLSNRPMINHVLLTGDVSIEDLGIQEAGDFVTNTSLTEILLDYVTGTNLTNTLSDYVTNSSLTTTLGDYSTKTNADAKAVIQIGSFQGTPKAGDMYVTF